MCYSLFIKLIFEFFRAKQDIQEAENLQLKLNEIMSKRIHLMLHIPNAKLTSQEALLVLDSFNFPDDKSMIDLLSLRKTVKSEIDHLSVIESELDTIRSLEESLFLDVDRQQQALEKAMLNVEAAKKAEDRARKALEDAKALVQSTESNLKRVQSTLTMYTNEMNETQYQVNKIQTNKERQQEKIRQVLRRKEQQYAAQKEVLSSNDSITLVSSNGDFDENTAEDARNQISLLMQEENELKNEINLLQASAERGLSRSKKLADRSEELEKEEQEAWDVLEQGLRVAEKAAQESNR